MVKFKDVQALHFKLGLLIISVLFHIIQEFNSWQPIVWRDEEPGMKLSLVLQLKEKAFGNCNNYKKSNFFFIDV